MTIIKIQFLLLNSILNTRLDEVYPNVFYCTSDYAKLSRYCCHRWNEFHQTEADQNLQHVSYDRYQTIPISYVVNRSFMCALSRFGWCLL